jgi:hypothetical protein
MMEHVMVDLETLGTRPGSVILSIGAAFFDPSAVGPAQLGSCFYQVIDVASSCVAGLRGDQETIAWWDKQDADVRVAYDEAFGGQGEPLVKTLEAFGAWLVSQSELPDGAERVKLWGNGAAFDNALLASAYHACGLAAPWKFFNDRCFRTLKDLGRTLRGVKEPPFQGVKHHALDDAVHQATWACLVLSALSISPVPEGDQGPRTFKAGRPQRYELPGRQGGKTHAQQELMPDPPAGYADALRHQTAKQWPVCQEHGVAMVPTASGFVCERCDVNDHGGS